LQIWNGTGKLKFAWTIEKDSPGMKNVGKTTMRKKKKYKKHSHNILCKLSGSQIFI
jgi:hypothetical protein